MYLTQWMLILNLKTNKVEAYDYLGNDPFQVTNFEYKTLGFVAFKDKRDAIAYGEQVLCQS